MDDAGSIHDLQETYAPHPVAQRLAAWLERSRSLVTADDAPAELPIEDPSAWVLDIAANGSRDSFALLFARFAPRVKSYLMKLGVRPDLAEELSQDTLLMVWRKAASFDPDRASAATWIFTIARNLRIDALRRERHPEALEHEPELTPQEAPPADSVVLTLQRLNRVHAAMDGLSEDQVAVVRLSYFENKPHSEISQDLRLPLGTVKSRLRLAMAKLRSQLEDLL